MAWLHLYNDVLPFTAMVAIECANVVLNVLFKAASLKGMSYYVFVVYSSAIGTLLFLPMLFIFHRDIRISVLPSLNFPLLSRICLLAVIGFVAQLAGYKGIEDSSPALASALCNLTPAFTFMLAVILRMEKIDLKSSRTRAKITGTILCISGALVVVLYKGPAILSVESPRATPSPLLNWSLGSANSDWFSGGILLAAQYLLFSIWFILQAQIMKMCPMELIVTFLYNFFAAIISAPVCLIAGRNLDAWKIGDSISLTAILFSAFIGACFTNLVLSWSSRLKGPVYIATFRPLSIAIAAIMGVTFLRDALHLGSVIGAAIISIGFYAVIWGKANEAKTTEENKSTSSFKHSSTEKVPLLQTSTEDP